ncbi:MAG: hypothetical protein II939_00965 [Bacteroidales bacterium]|nr:hypothetical protein [Bacteroidales bacterium]
MENLTRYTLFVDGEEKASHQAEPFSNSPLEKAEQLIIKECLDHADGVDGSTKQGNLVRKCLAKFVKFLFKFQKFLLVKVLLGSKTASSVHIVCLCVEYDTEIAANIPFYPTDTSDLEMRKKAADNAFVNGKGIAH